MINRIAVRGDYFRSAGYSYSRVTGVIDFIALSCDCGLGSRSFYNTRASDGKFAALGCRAVNEYAVRFGSGNDRSFADIKKRIRSGISRIVAAYADNRAVFVKTDSRNRSVFNVKVTFMYLNCRATLCGKSITSEIEKNGSRFSFNIRYSFGYFDISESFQHYLRAVIDRRVDSFLKSLEFVSYFLVGVLSYVFTDFNAERSVFVFGRNKSFRTVIFTDSGRERTAAYRIGRVNEIVVSFLNGSKVAETDNALIVTFVTGNNYRSLGFGRFTGRQSGVIRYDHGKTERGRAVVVHYVRSFGCGCGYDTIGKRKIYELTFDCRTAHNRTTRKRYIAIFAFVFCTAGNVDTRR